MDSNRFIHDLSYSQLAEAVIFLIGLTILIFWLIRTSFARKSLSNSPPRRTNMPAYLPFIALLIWFAIASSLITASRKFLLDLTDLQSVFLENIILCTAAVLSMPAVMFLASRHFARRLKGFGLSTANIPKDILIAPLNLLAVWPLVVITLALTIYLGKLFLGPDFQIQQHQELKMISAYSQLLLRTLIFITVAVVIPVFEEMLFRGMFQTMVRSFIKKPWPSIIISSLVFAAVHDNKGHWPALFVLGLCLGYSYEKSGSLLRPVFIHSLFNTASLIAAIYQ